MLKGRILSGMRPTGRLHLGNYEGALRNWVRLQDEYECFYEVADWHALTTGFEHTADLRGNRRETVKDWLAAGLNPERSVLFVQSDVKEHAELHLLLSMITPTSWLTRNPTVKEQARELGLVESDDDEQAMLKLGYGHLGYPVLQAADILVYRADSVPVGKDQVGHLEISREIVRRFNHLYDCEVLVEPQPLLTEFPAIPGTDGRKMSKSYGNGIELADDATTTTKKVRSYFTDPLKLRRGDPGRPEICPVFTMHQVYNRAETDSIGVDCRSGALGCVDCKTRLAEQMNDALAPLRERRAELDREPGAIDNILADGAARARAVAAQTMAEVRQAMQLVGSAVPPRIMPVRISKG